MQKIAHKRHILVAFSLLVVLAGCKDRNGGKSIKRGQKQAALQNMPLKQAENQQVALFDEDLEMFVLDEEANVFAQDDLKVASNEEQLDFNWHENATEDLATVYFSYDSRAPRKDQEENLQKAGELAKKLVAEGKDVVLKGHACQWRGTAAYNLAISCDRTAPLKDYLINEVGIPADKVKTFGVGREEPMVLADNKDAHAPNRRVEVYGVVA